ncbi:popeye domain-containing 2 isoform X2 [Takifugu rubripes]|uniref:Popeye domain cAMP effector 2 n=1 Tax=Takifugu rubripes TaxID=31033 RepID=H2UUV4_TAKRU|nr:popeye domain-containing protein 2 isoform X2 [Takifugu rubripes]|eukprot:XP_011611827.1 PREDICTED: popeye domain-containing protein 2 isoform X2 [Takifugu rubripes]
MSSDNSSLLDSLFSAPLCDGWSNNTEGAIYHLGHTLLFLGYMGGSGAYGCLFIFGFLTPAFSCLSLWGWMTMCGLDVFSWNLLLLLACLAQICHLLFRLHQEGIRSEELTSLYQAVYLPLGVPVQVFKEITGAFENKVMELKAGETYALEGKTPIDRLSFLLSGRMNVSLEGQFLHYIHRHQFLDSPEWESLRPSEDGKFQVTLTAEEDSRYITWRRRRLYLLMSKNRYIARLFSIMLGYDIAEKLYNLNNKLYIKSGMLLDIRLPSLYHVLAPASQGSEGGSGSDGGYTKEQEAEQKGEGPAPAYQHGDPPQSQGPSKNSVDGSRAPPHWWSDPELPSGDDSGGNLPPRFLRVRAPLAPTDTPKL